MPAVRVQNKVPRQSVYVAGQPRVPKYFQDLRVLGRVQKTVHHEVVEAVHQPLQLPPGGRPHRRQNSVHARGAEPQTEESGADQKTDEAFPNPRLRNPLRLALVGPRARAVPLHLQSNTQEVGRQRAGSLLCFQRESSQGVSGEARIRFNSQRTSSYGGRLLVFRTATARNHFQCTWLHG